MYVRRVESQRVRRLNTCSRLYLLLFVRHEDWCMHPRVPTRPRASTLCSRTRVGRTLRRKYTTSRASHSKSLTTGRRRWPRSTRGGQRRSLRSRKVGPCSLGALWSAIRDRIEADSDSATRIHTHTGLCAAIKWDEVPAEAMPPMAANGQSLKKIRRKWVFALLQKNGPGSVAQYPLRENAFA